MTTTMIIIIVILGVRFREQDLAIGFNQMHSHITYQTPQGGIHKKISPLILGAKNSQLSALENTVQKIPILSAQKTFNWGLEVPLNNFAPPCPIPIVVRVDSQLTILNTRTYKEYTISRCWRT